jgi:hypothetical protein
VSTSNRNRSEGWRHAKLDGHANEKQFAELLVKNSTFISEIEKHITKKSPKGPPEITVDGAKHVESIFGDMTTSKVDLSLKWESGEEINISLKKSNSGQVWLVSVPRFISAIEFHLKHKLDAEVRMGISLFIGGSNLADFEDYFKKALASDKKKNPRIVEQEIHQTRLVAQSIHTNYPSVWEATLNFFKVNIDLITRLSFAQGLAKSMRDSADVIVFNKLTDGPSIFPIPRMIKNAKSSINKESIMGGPKNGGSTLLLPTGFLQMHHPQSDNLLQFHHQYKKIFKL